MTRVSGNKRFLLTFAGYEGEGVKRLWEKAIFSAFAGYMFGTFTGKANWPTLSYSDIWLQSQNSDLE